MMGSFTDVADAIAGIALVKGVAFAVPPQTAKVPNARERKIAGIRDMGVLRIRIYRLPTRQL
jgi:hypothetical protein